MDSKQEKSLRIKFLSIGILGSVGVMFVLGLGILAGNKTREYIDSYHWERHKVIEIKPDKSGLSINLPITRETKLPIMVLVPTVNPTVTKMVANREIIELTQEEKEAVIRGTRYPSIIEGIWTLETTKGKGRNDNDPTNHQSNCAKAGMSNEFGYDPQGKTCFDTFEESVAFIDKYINDHLTSMSVNQVLCYWNIGKAIDTCDYVENYRALDRQGRLALK